MFQFESEGSKKSRCPRSKAVRQEEFPLTGGMVEVLFYSGLQLIGRGPPALGRAICFIQSTDLNVNCIQQHPHRNNQNDV